MEGAEILHYAKQFLSPISIFLDCNKNIGDRIDYSQRNNGDIGEEVRHTLDMLEAKGGPGALRLIKFSIPACKIAQLLLLYILYCMYFL